VRVRLEQFVTVASKEQKKKKKRKEFDEEFFLWEGKMGDW